MSDPINIRTLPPGARIVVRELPAAAFTRSPEVGPNPAVGVALADMPHQSTDQPTPERPAQ